MQTESRQSPARSPGHELADTLPDGITETQSNIIEQTIQEVPLTTDLKPISLCGLKLTFKISSDDPNLLRNMAANVLFYWKKALRCGISTIEAFCKAITDSASYCLDEYLELSIGGKVAFWVGLLMVAFAIACWFSPTIFAAVKVGTSAAGVSAQTAISNVAAATEGAIAGVTTTASSATAYLAAIVRQVAAYVSKLLADLLSQANLHMLFQAAHTSTSEVGDLLRNPTWVTGYALLTAFLCRCLTMAPVPA